MNDMGDYMFSQYKGRWIQDTPARRKAIIKRLAGWRPFSNSSPVEGIEAAIRRFYASDKRISLYVFGDDFARGSIQAVIDTVDQLNRANRSGKRRVRIHAIGFPVIFAQGGIPLNTVSWRKTTTAVLSASTAPGRECFRASHRRSSGCCRRSARCRHHLDGGLSLLF